MFETQKRAVEEKVDEMKARSTNEMVCHIHDERDRHIGTGVGEDMEEALKRAAGSASQSKRGEALDIGGFGCGTTPDEAHERAVKEKQ